MKKLIIVFLLFISVNAILAQEAIPASGGNASGSGGSVSYTVGQVVYSTSSGTNGSVAQGVQQPYEISAVTGIEQFKNISLTFSAFPNPTTDFLTLKIDGDIHAHFTASIYDLNGKIMFSRNIESKETTFPMGVLVPATYFLRVTNNIQEIKSFKIIKK